MGASQSAQAYDGPQEVAGKLGRRTPCLLAFMSPQCGLCASLRPALEQVASSRDDGLQVAVLSTQLDRQWAPEMLAYDVDTVPCFVLLAPDGRAVCKTPAPRGRLQMEAALQAMAQHAGTLQPAPQPR